MVLIKYFVCWLLILIVAEVDHHVLVHGAGAVVGLGDCAETRCKHDGPDISDSHSDSKTGSQSIVVTRALIYHAPMTTKLCSR